MIKREDIDDNILISLNKRNENWQIVEDIKNDLNTQKEDYANYKGSNNLKIATVEKELNDYKSTMANVNVNQEAKQSATGYGVVSLPKNAANGQVSVSVKGNTETDEEGNTKSTVSASRLKSVGKNLFDKNSAIQNKYVKRSDGLLGSSDGHYVSDFISVKPNTTYRLTNFAYTVVAGAVSYDVNKNFIADLSPNGDRTVTTPSNAAFIRFSITSGNIDTAQFELGTIATPYEPYTESTQYLPNVGELRSLPNGVADSVEDGKLIKRVKKGVIGEDKNISFFYSKVEGDSVDFRRITLHNSLTSVVNVEPTHLTIPNYEYIISSDRDNDANIGKYSATGSVDSTALWFIFPKGTTQQQMDDELMGQEIIYQLAKPIENSIEVSGTLLSSPSGTVYIEPVVADAGIYDEGISVLHQDLPINYIEGVSKVDFTTGLETELDAAQCVIAEDKLSFTHPDLTSNDIVFFTYFHNLEGTQGETTIEYYDSRHTLKDTVTGKFYKVVPTVSDGVLTNQLVEV